MFSAFIMKVGDKTTEEIRRKLLKDEETGERRWVLPLLIVLMTGGVLFIRKTIHLSFQANKLFSLHPRKSNCTTYVLLLSRPG